MQHCTRAFASQSFEPAFVPADLTKILGASGDALYWVYHQIAFRLAGFTWAQTTPCENRLQPKLS
jgi:hypothetical protein